MSSKSDLSTALLLVGPPMLDKGRQTDLLDWGLDVGFTSLYDYDMVHLLTEIWLSPGGSSTVHIHTQTVHRTI
jgi:hypothetical protein